MFGYYQEYEPAIGIPDSWGPLHSRTYTEAIESMMSVVTQDVRWHEGANDIESVTINTDHTGSPELWFVTYTFAGSRDHKVQTDIFTLLWPDETQYNDGDIRQCVSCGAANFYTEPFDPELSRPVYRQGAHPGDSLCNPCADRDKRS